MYYISTENKVNLPTLIFQNFRDVVKVTRNGSRNMRNSIPLVRLISDILTESKLIDSLTNAEKTEGWNLLLGFFSMIRV